MTCPPGDRPVRLGSSHLGDDATAEDDDDAVAGELDLLELRGIQEHGGASRGQVSEQLVDLLLRADVDAARRVEAEHRLDAAGYPPGDRDLLLVAAGQAADFGRGPRVDLEGGDRLVHLAPLDADVDQAPCVDRGRERQGDVLANGTLHEQRLRAVRGDIDETLPDRVRRVAERDRRAVDEELAAAGALGSRQYVEQFVLSLSLERHEAEHLARVQVERDVGELRSRGEVASADAGRRAVALGGRRPGRSACRGHRHRVGDVAEHQAHDPIVGSFRDVNDADRHALAEHCRSVADGADFDESVGDEDHRALRPPVAADHLEDLLREVGGQGRRDLVEHEDRRLDREGSGEVDHPERCQWKVADHAGHVEVRQTELSQPMANGFQRRVRESQVRANVEVRDQGGFLVHGDDPAGPCFGW